MNDWAASKLWTYWRVPSLLLVKARPKIRIDPSLAETVGPHTRRRGEWTDMLSSSSPPSGTPNATTNPVTCIPFPSQPERCDVLLAIWRWVSVLSLIGSASVILLIFRLGKQHCLPQRLILSLSVAAILLSISGILSDSAVKHLSVQCRVQGVLLQFGVWSVLLWVSCISFNVFWNVINKERTSRRLELAYHAVAWGFSLIMACMPFPLGGDDVYGPTGGWCWITSQNKLLRFTMFYIPLYSLLLVIIAVYLAIMLRYSRVRRWEGSYNPEDERLREQDRQSARTLLVYPLVYVLLSAFPLINRIQQAIEGEGSAVYALVVLHALSAPMMGFANTIVYAWDRETLRRMSEAFKQRRHRRSVSRHSPIIKDYYADLTTSYTALKEAVDEEYSNVMASPWHSQLLAVLCDLARTSTWLFWKN